MSVCRHAIMRWSIIAASLFISVPRAGAALDVGAGIGLVTITGAAPGAQLVLEDQHHGMVASGTADSYGSLIFRELTQGGRYAVRDGGTGTVTPVTVLRFRDHPKPSFSPLGRGISTTRPMVPWA